MSVKDVIFLSEIGSGFGEQQVAHPHPPRIPRDTPPRVTTITAYWVASKYSSILLV